MLILGQKGANLDQKGPKMGEARFFLDCKHQFSKKDHMISFYTKNQQNSINSSEDISQLDVFKNLGQKSAFLMRFQCLSHH